MYGTSRGGGPGRLPGAVAGGGLRAGAAGPEQLDRHRDPRDRRDAAQDGLDGVPDEGDPPGEVPEQVADLVR